jgi:hypothetical protein
LGYSNFSQAHLVALDFGLTEIERPVEQDPVLVLLEAVDELGRLGVHRQRHEAGAGEDEAERDLGSIL